MRYLNCSAYFSCLNLAEHFHDGRGKHLHIHYMPERIFCNAHGHVCRILPHTSCMLFRKLQDIHAQGQNFSVAIWLPACRCPHSQCPSECIFPSFLFVLLRSPGQRSFHKPKHSLARFERVVHDFHFS